MKKLKKIMALLLAMVMVLGMTTTIMAADEPTPAKVYGVEEEENITVKAYQIISYDENGSYKEVIEGTIEKDNKGQLAPTVENIQNLATKIKDLPTVKELTKNVEGNKIVYTSNELTAGSWMIIVEGSEKYIYNPAILSVNVTADGIDVGELDLDKGWNNGATYLKKNIPTIKKEATDVSDEPKVEGVQYGDIIKFQITTDIPRYASGKTGITYKISDTLNGLSLVNEGKYLASAKVGTDNNWITNDTTLNNAVADGINQGIENNQGKEFTVALNNDTWIKQHGGQKIVLTYYAKVTSEAKVTVDKLTNTAKLDYSTADKFGSTSDDTEHYTFGIDTTVTGSTAGEHTSGEFIKVDENGKVEYVEGHKDVIVTEGNPLAGAVFELHIGTEDGPLFTDKTGKNKFTTTDDGRLEILGLDSDTTYYLVEITAPDGYTLNEEVVKVEIEATYNDEGKLDSYDVIMNGSLTAHYKWDGTTSEIEGSPENPMNPFGFKNTKLTQLPSTGGIGTTIFTVAGCAIMIGAVALFFASRKKQSK